MRRALRFTTLTLVAVVCGTAAARGTPVERCAAAKIKAAGRKASCLLALDARVAGGGVADSAKMQQCRDRLGGAFAKAEGRGGCATGGDASTVEGQVDATVGAVYTALNVATPNACQKTKLAAAGKKAKCLLGLEAKGVSAGGADPSRLRGCRDRMTAAFANAEQHGGCSTVGDAATVEASIDMLVDTVVAEEPTTVTCAMAGCPAPVPCDTSQGACWRPEADTRFQYQLQAATTGGGACAFPSTGGIHVGISAVPFTGGAAAEPLAYDIDLLVDPVCAAGGSNDVENSAAVAAIHAAGARAVCYVDAGTDEPFRPDHQAYVDFDTACGGCLFGKAVNGFAEEHWLDIDDDMGQRTFILGKVAARVDRCKSAGFDAVEFDNVDGYSNATGLPLSYESQLLFNTALANLAHARGLTVGLKNDLDQIPELLPYFDLAIDEQCQQFAECDALAPFTDAAKPVFQVEYQGTTASFCPQANAAGRNAILKDVDLFDVPWTPCR